MPWDVGASNDEAAAYRNRDTRVAALDSGYLRTQQQYGLEGPWADFNSNPYSQAALLQRSYDNAQRGTVNSYASQGQLYAGSTVNARNANTREFDLNRNRLQEDYAQAGAEYSANRAGADDQFNEDLIGADWDRVETGVGEELEPDAAPAGRRKNKQRKAQPKRQQPRKNNPPPRKGRRR